MLQSPRRPAVRALRFKRDPFQSSNEPPASDNQERSGLVRRLATGRSLAVVDEVGEPWNGERDGDHRVHPFIGVKTVTDAAPSLSGSALTSLSTFTTSGSAVSTTSQSPSTSPPSPTASSTSPAVSTSDTSSSSNPLPSGTGTVEAANDSNGSSGSESKGHSGLSGGAVAAIVVILLLLLGAAGFFLLRKRFKGRGRRLPRAFWKAGIPATPDDFSIIEKGSTSYSNERQAINLFPPSVATPINPPAPQTAAAALRAVQRIPPPSDNPFSDAHSVAGSDAPGEEQQRPARAATTVPVMAQVKETPTPVTTSLSIPPTPRSLILPRSPARTTPVTTEFNAPPVPAGASALVRVIFIPSMPDELAIEVGDVLHVLSAYDDGWALCSNARGAQGMVPLECLDGGGGHFGMGPNTESMADPARLSRRASSLYAVNRTSTTSANSRVR